MEEKINQFSCTDCSKSFGTVQALTAHRRIHKTTPGVLEGVILPLKAPNGLTDEELSAYKQIQDDEFAAMRAQEFSPLEETKVIDLPNFPEDDLKYFRGEFPATPSIIVKVKRLPHGKDLPEIKRATTGSAAVDLYAAIDKVVWIGPSEQAKPPVPTGIAVEIPEGYVGKIAPRSGLAAKNGISIMNSPGIIDSDYRGEIMITLVNHSRHRFPINPGDRIAQMLIEKVEPVVFQYVDELSETQRGEGGFGSTGVSEKIVASSPPKVFNFLDSTAKPDGVHVRKLSNEVFE